MATTPHEEQQAGISVASFVDEITIQLNVGADGFPMGGYRVGGRRISNFSESGLQLVDPIIEPMTEPVKMLHLCELLKAMAIGALAELEEIKGGPKLAIAGSSVDIVKEIQKRGK